MSEDGKSRSQGSSTRIVSVLAAMAVVALGVWYGRRLVSRSDVDASAPQPAASTDSLAPVVFGSFSSAIDYAPLYVLLERKILDSVVSANGRRLTFVEFQSLPSLNEALAVGAVDFVFEAEPPAIIAKAAGVPVKIIAIGASLRQEILVPSRSTIRSLRGLKGKSIAVLAGTSSHYAVLANTESLGISGADLKIRDMIPPDAKAAFESGQVDAWAVWPPWVEQELVSGRGRVLPGGEAQIHSIVAVRPSVLTGSDKLAKDFVAALDRAKQWLSANRSDGISLVAKRLNLPDTVVAMAWPKHNWAATLSDQVQSDIQRKADFLFRLKLISDSVRVTDLVSPMGASASRP